MIASFKELQKIKLGTRLLQFPKIKSPKIPELSLTSFVGMPVLCVPVFLYFFHDCITFNLRETKRQARVTIFLYCNYARVKFHDCFYH